MTAISQALMDARQNEEAWTVAKEGLTQVDAPSLLRLQLGKLAARTGLHREEGLAMLDQVLREPLEGGSGGYAAAHWRERPDPEGPRPQSRSQGRGRSRPQIDPSTRGQGALRGLVTVDGSALARFCPRMEGMHPDQLTIVIPTVNRLPLLRRALESAVAQTVPVRILVSDNGSNDGTKEFLEGFTHPRLSKKRIEETISSQDPSEAACIGGWYGVGRLPCRMMTTWNRNFAARIVAHHDAHPECAIVYARDWIHIWNSSYAGKAGQDIEQGCDFMMEFLMGHREPCWCAMALRMEDIRRIGPQPPDRHIGDMYYWIRILADHKIGCVPEPLAHYLYASDEVKNTTSGISLRAWHRNPCSRPTRCSRLPRAVRQCQGRSTGALRRMRTQFVARSCANQIIWNRIRGRGVGTLLRESWTCARVFAATPIVWPRVIGGVLLPMRWVRARVSRHVEKVLAKANPSYPAA